MDQKTKNQNKKYNDYIEKVTPKHSSLLNCTKAFVCGGIICVIGQLLTNFYLYLGLHYDLATAYTTLTLIAISVILTGFNLAGKITKFAGAGFLVPITGFANSIASCAIEFKKEGWVFGVGCKIFNIAGPVILYGIVTSGLFGVIYYILTCISVV